MANRLHHRCILIQKIRTGIQKNAATRSEYQATLQRKTVEASLRRRWAIEYRRANHACCNAI
ncbi:MAG: hypothetical protein ACLU3I_22395 [Acutalibacteraceae bacterium]